MTTIKVGQLSNAQAASNAAVAGDVVDFSGCSGTLAFTPKNGVTYALNGATLTSPGAAAIFSLPDGAHDITIAGPGTVNGRAVYSVPAGNVYPSNIRVVHLTARGNLYDGHPNPCSIWAIGWDAKCLVAWNDAQTQSDGFVEAFGGCGTIQSNHIHDGSQGLKLEGNGPNSKGWRVLGNYGGNMSRIYCEMQGFVDLPGVVVEDNQIIGANIAPDPQNCMALSIATDGAKKVSIQRNLIRSFERDPHINNGVGMVIAIETSADPTIPHALLCEDNAIYGTNAAIAMQPSLQNVVINNHVEGSLGGVQKNTCKDPDPRWATTNGPQVGATPTLTWNVNRTYPLPQYADGAAPSPTPTPPPMPTPTYTGKVVNGQAQLSDGPQSVDTGTSNVVSVFQVGANWYQLTTAGQVWTLPGHGAQNVTASVKPPGAVTPVPSGPITGTLTGKLSDGSTATVNISISK